MSIKINDLYVNTVAQGLMQPGEQLLARTAGSYQPFWSFKIPFFKHWYLFLVTNQRLIVLDHRRGLIHDRLDTVESHSWTALGQVKVTGLFPWTKGLLVSGNQVRLRVKLQGALFSNGVLVGAKTAVSTWQQARGIGAGAARPQLPPAAQAAAAARRPVQPRA